MRILSRLPSAGSATLRLAMRNLATQRSRTATTLLALAAGMFALSSIAFAGQAVSEVLRFTFAQTLGGNILVFPLLPSVFPPKRSKTSPPALPYAPRHPRRPLPPAGWRQRAAPSRRFAH